MDPLSITSAIVGLLTAAGKVYALLEVFSAIRNAPAAIKDAQNEVQHAEIALRSMQRLLHRLDVSNPRRSLIQVDELRITLADAMLAFSAFETMLQRLASLTRVRVAISWVKFSKQMDEHVARIGRHQQSLTLMMSILQCDSDLEAYLSQQKLQSLIEKVLAENTELRQKLAESLRICSPCAVATRHPEDENATIRQRKNGNDDASTLRGVGRTYSIQSAISHFSNVGNFGGGIIRFAFENILEQSRVYRRNANQVECDRSYTSTAQVSHAWSVFSGYSLADISVLSVIAMPLTTLDIENGNHYPTHPQNGSSMKPQGGMGLAITSSSTYDYASWPALRMEDPVWLNGGAERQPEITSMEIDRFSQGFSAALEWIGEEDEKDEEEHNHQQYKDYVGASGGREQGQEARDATQESREEEATPLWQQNRRQNRNLMWV
ncbi:hypothetical protein C8A01DRAFT_20607 [Parachaetomium inaequale]|uniref:Fungal N-terminal domain-containing protein n=1 Tax=Parachaetomium inaequale TaxID=2588326 RepID=A0AAN6SM20_9PEZI|nr:hypothetical protein C8A01DRAFT_20607 [Parachaetomium inaequale]